jgi:hypothetical protein
MTPSALEHIRFAPLQTQVQPGERCTATLLGVPDGATIAWAVGGAEAVAEGGLGGASIVLCLKPDTVELLSAPAAPTHVRICATVTLDGASRSLETAVSALPLRIPSLLALFRNRAFSAADYGAALLVAPGSSPLSSVPGVRAAVEQLHAATERLSVFARFATLRDRVATLLTALRTHEHLTFVRTDALADFGTLTLIPRGVLADAITAEDEMSSAILLGPAGRRARLFIHRGFEQSGGRLDVDVDDENIVLLADLGAAASVPAGRAHVIVAPGRRGTFDDELSSVQLAKPAFRSTLAGAATLGSDTVEIELSLAFNGTHRNFGIDSFVDSASRVALAGSSSGTFDPATGETTLSLRLAVGAAEVPFQLTGTVDLETGEITLSDAAQLSISGVLDSIP